MAGFGVVEVPRSGEFISSACVFILIRNEFGLVIGLMKVKSNCKFLGVHVW